MSRYKLIVEYCGTNYHGMQKQNNIPTIQFALENAINKYCGQNTIEYCGRTDAGVHAIGQVIHFDIPFERKVHSIINGINFYLSAEKIKILDAEKVSDTFHCRFDVKKRYYIYKIFNRPQKLTFLSETHLHCYKKLDIEKMQLGANYLFGKHDFTSFRATNCSSKSPVKTLDYIKISQINHIHGNEIIIEICAKSFLYHMVRNIVGSLILVGYGKKPPEWIEYLINAKDRRKAGETVPAFGLYFYKAEY